MSPRQQAIANGDKTYHGKPCKAGHTEKRTAKGDCVECLRIRNATYDAKPEKQLRAASIKLKRLYGLTFEQFYDMVAEQDYRCKICFEPFKQWEFSPVHRSDTCVDHDHDTGLVRGILCSNCNKGIGFLADNRNHVANALMYMTSSQSY